MQKQMKANAGGWREGERPGESEEKVLLSCRKTTTNPHILKSTLT